MSRRRHASLALVLVLLLPTVLPVFAPGRTGHLDIGAHPASCACPRDACGCDHGATSRSCALPDSGIPDCGLQGSPCGSASPQGLAWYSLGPYAPPAAFRLAPPPPGTAHADEPVTAAPSLPPTPIEYPPEALA